MLVVAANHLFCDIHLQSHMSSQGDDCYFYFYSTCTKGDSCPFRHCKAALGNETVCTLWQEGRCFRQICKFRHMEIDKKRSAIPCFWENQLSGCQKGNCAFHHSKGRYVDGLYISPSKTQTKTEPSESDLEISQTPSKITAVSTTHLRGVKNMEASENVPSPTHPPVVINAADDDEDDDGPDFGIKTLEEIKSNRKRVREEPDDGEISSLNVLEFGPIAEKKVTVIRTVMLSKNVAAIQFPCDIAGTEGGSHLSPEIVVGPRRAGPPDMCRNLAQRLGKRKALSQESTLGGESCPAVKKTVSERLGKKMPCRIVGSDAPPQKKRAANPTTDFHIKTLQEIRQEKASQRQEQESKCLSMESEGHFCLKSNLFIKSTPDIHVKTLYEIHAEKKPSKLKDGRQKDENMINKSDCKVRKDFEDKKLKESEKNQEYHRVIKPANLTGAVPRHVETEKSLLVSLKETKAISNPVEQVKIKTLEEIRKEKFLRHQYKPQATNTECLESVSQLQVKSKHKRILHLPKPKVSKETDQCTSDISSNNAETGAKSKTTIDFGTPVLAAVKFEEAGSKKTLKTEFLNSANFTDKQSITQSEAECSAEPIKILLGKSSKGKPKVNLEPNVMNKQFSTKVLLKQKAQQNSPVAEVKPLNTITFTDNRTTDLPPLIESSMSQHFLMKSPSTNPLKESSQVHASDPGYSDTVQTGLKSRRASCTLSGKPSVLTEDDFDELIWNISDGKLEDEIVLDPSKDEDDLLMELSEMIDS